MILSRTFLHRRISIALAFCLAGVVASPPAFAAGASDVVTGAALFRRECAGCHGRRATGGRGPDLTRGTFRHAGNDADLFRLIATGIPGTAMPGAAATHPDGIWQLVAYIRSLGGGLPQSAGPGDAAAGRRLFAGRAGCVACHQLSGTGARGPNLADVGRGRSSEALRRALVAPEKATAGWFVLRVTDRRGTTHVGRRLDEDTYSVRLLKEDGTLRAFDRASVRSIEHVSVSRMPSYATTLTPVEIDYLVAYLRSLRK